ncbi:MAG: hypothetical protein ACI4DK_10130 [Lachnospiraceae bacterium]
MKVKVLGISSYEKEGQKYFNVYVATPFSDRMLEAGAQGVQVKAIWSSANQVDFSGVNPGDYLDLVYEPGFQDKATLVSFSPLTTPFNQHIEGILSDNSGSADKPKK